MALKVSLMPDLLCIIYAGKCEQSEVSIPILNYLCLVWTTNRRKNTEICMLYAKSSDA